MVTFYDTPDCFKNTTASDLFGFVTGKSLGAGAFREVFEYLPLRDAVIKVEQRSCRFENVLEFEIWQEVKDTEHAKWFAPCIDISSNGIWMTQKQTRPCPEGKLPTKVPAYFTDIKRDNIGIYKGHPCFHDYGRTRLIKKGLTKRMKTIDWNEVGLLQ